MVTAGEILKKKRESLGKDLTTVSIDTKIQKRFLEYIESDQYDKFDSDVFTTGFIKIYSKYLELDVDKLLAVYRRSNLHNGKEVEKKDVFQLKGKKSFPKLNITPQAIAIITLTIFLLLVIGYIGYQIFKFQTPPHLNISEPLDEFTTEEPLIIVKGSTDTSSTVDINGEPVEIDDVGYFEKELTLNEGINTISITAKKKENNRLETNQSLKVIYTPIDVAQQPPVVEIKDVTVVIKTLQSSAWIKLDIDGENKISKVLEPNSQTEFVATSSLTLVTGRILSTILEINGENIEITSSQSSGVGQISCIITEGSYKCE